jgi:hypothetical protein
MPAAVRATILALGLGVLLIWIVGGSPTFQACMESKPSKTNYQHLDEDVFSLSVPFARYRDCLGGFVHEFRDDIIAAGTAVLAFATLFLWFATTDLAKASERGMRQTQRALVASQKWDLEPIYRNGVTDSFIFTARWENFGATAANHCEAGSTYTLLEGRDVATVPFKDNFLSRSNNMTIGPRGNFGSSTPIPIADLLRVNRGEARAFLLGRIEYTDVFGAKHHTQACVEVQVLGNPAYPPVVSPALPPNVFRMAIWREHNSST